MKFTKNFFAKFPIVGLLSLCFMFFMTGEVRAEFRYDFYLKKLSSTLSTDNTNTLVGLLVDELKCTDTEAMDMINRAYTEEVLIRGNMTSGDYYEMRKPFIKNLRNVYKTDISGESEDTYIIKISKAKNTLSFGMKLKALVGGLNESLNIIEGKLPILETDSIDEIAAYKVILENGGCTVEVLPTMPETSPNLYTVMTNAKCTPEQLTAIKSMFFKIDEKALNDVRYVFNNISIEAARGISNILNNNTPSIPSSVSRNAEIWLTYLGEDPDAIKEYVSRTLNITDITSLPRLLDCDNSNESIPDMIDWINGINNLGGTAELRKVCWINIYGDYQNKFTNAPVAVITGTEELYVPFGDQPDALIPITSSINPYRIFLNNTQITEFHENDNGFKTNIKQENIYENLQIQLSDKLVSITSRLDEAEFVYNGKGIDLLEYIDFENGLTVADFDISYNFDRYDLNTGNHISEVYDKDNPPMFPGSDYKFNMYPKDNLNYYNGIEFSYNIKKAPLVVKPKDINAYVGSDIAFETEYLGFVSGDESKVAPKEQFSYWIVDQGSENMLQPIVHDWSYLKNTEGTYSIVYSKNLNALFNENDLYDISLDYGTLRINKKDLNIKIEDITIFKDDEVTFDATFDGLISGDKFGVSLNYELISLNDESAVNPTIISLEDAINTPGKYIIRFDSETIRLIENNTRYNTTIENGMLLVKNPTSVGDATAFSIIVKDNKNVDVEPGMKVIVKKNDDKTFTFDTKKGYEITDVIINGKSVGAIDEYTFKKVSKDYIIEIKTSEIEDTQKDSQGNKNFYIDVTKDDWFYDAIKYVTDESIMNGTGDNKYSPYLDTTRGMIVTILYRLEGNPVIKEMSTFTDVEENKWYTDAISWGEKHGIILGYGDGTFGVFDNITREQLSAIMYRYANYKNYNTQTEDYEIPYNGRDEISEYAVIPMTWACKISLIQGIGNNELSPKTGATRAQVATVLTRFCKTFMD